MKMSTCIYTQVNVHTHTQRDTYTDTHTHTLEAKEEAKVAMQINVPGKPGGLAKPIRYCSSLLVIFENTY